MKRLPYAIIAALLVFVGSFSLASAVSVFTVQQGGTGWGSPGGFKAHTVLVGNDLGAIATITPSTSGFVLTSNGVGSDPTFQAATGGGTFPFTPATNWGVNTSATTTALWGQNSIFASSTSLTVPALAASNSNATGPALLVGTGYVGIGTTSPIAQFSVNPDGITGPAFAIGSSTLTEFYINNAGAAFVGSTTKLVAGSGWSATTPGNLQVANNLGVLGFVEADNGYNVGGTSVITSASNLVNIGGVIRAASTKGLAFQTNAANTTYLTITSTGYTGVGTTTPWLNFQVASITPQLGISNPNAGTNLKHWYWYNDVNGALNLGTSTDLYATSTPYILTATNAGLVGLASSTPWAQFSINPNGITGPAFAIGSSTQTLFQVSNAGVATFLAGTNVDALGNIGVGRAAQDDAGYGQVALGGTTGGSVSFYQTSTVGAQFYYDGAGVHFRTKLSTVPIIFDINNNEQARIATNGNIGFGTTTPRFELSVASSTGPQLALSDTSATAAPFTFRAVNSSFYLSTSSPTTFATSTTPILTILDGGVSGLIGLATSSPWAGLSINAPAAISPFAIGSSTNPILWVDSLGKTWIRDILNGWNGIQTPTRYFALSAATTTTMLGTSTAPYNPQLVLPFAGTVQNVQCFATTTNAFIGIQPYIGTTALTFLVASNTVGVEKFTSSNTFTAGQVLSFAYGTGTALTNNQGVTCSFAATQTS